MSKVIAIIDKPKDCHNCTYGVCKYSTPLTTRRKSYYCQLKKPSDRVVEEFDYDEVVYLSNCPLKEVPQKQTIHSIDTPHHRWAKNGYNACIDKILEGGEEE